MDLKMGNRGQLTGITGIFVLLIIWFALTAAWSAIAPELINNVISPNVTNEPNGDIAILLMQVAAYIMWFIIPIVIIAAGLQSVFSRPTQ